MHGYWATGDINAIYQLTRSNNTAHWKLKVCASKPVGYFGILKRSNEWLFMNQLLGPTWKPLRRMDG
jgi:hypothetical protein